MSKFKLSLSKLLIVMLLFPSELGVFFVAAITVAKFVEKLKKPGCNYYSENPDACSSVGYTLYTFAIDGPLSEQMVRSVREASDDKLPKAKEHVRSLVKRYRTLSKQGKSAKAQQAVDAISTIYRLLTVDQRNELSYFAEMELGINLVNKAVMMPSFPHQLLSEQALRVAKDALGDEVKYDSYQALENPHL